MHCWFTVLHVASPRIDEAKYFIISHVACKYTCKKHSSFSFKTLLFMPRLSEDERSDAIGMLKAGVRVSDVARYHNCHPSKIFYHNNLKSCPISRQISNCNLRIVGYCYLIDCCFNSFYCFDITFKHTLLTY